MKAMLLAAGRGERMRPLTDTTPKPLLEAGGQPLVAWHLQRLAQAGITDIVINLSWLGEQIAQRLGDGSAYGVAIAYSREPWPALETGGGLRQALPLLGSEPFLLVNGDVFTDIDFRGIALRSGDLAQLVLVPNPAHHPQGDFWLDAAGRVVAQATGERLTYSGVAIIDPALLADSEPGRFPLLPLLLSARDSGRLGGQKHSGRWLDIGTPQRLAELDAELSRMRP
ncbi:MAG: nucleotidyltransferase family protein [Steroidobacteraceae bacterium]